MKGLGDWLDRALSFVRTFLGTSFALVGGGFLLD